MLYWKWFKSQDKTRFITDPDYVWPEPRPVDPETVKRNEKMAQLEAQKVQQEWEEFVDALPLCGSHVMYKGTDIYGERLAGRFIFETADLLPMVFDRLKTLNLFRWTMTIAQTIAMMLKLKLTRKQALG